MDPAEQQATFFSPHCDADAAAVIDQIGALRLRLHEIGAAERAAIAQVRALARAAKDQMRHELEQRMVGLHTYCQVNRSRLTARPQGRHVKFHRFGTGVVSWRLCDGSTSEERFRVFPTRSVTTQIL